MSLNYIDYISHLADQFKYVIDNSESAEFLPTKDYGWENHRWASPKFRIAHVEKFVQTKFAVLHTVILPHLTDPSPIFGFDVIVGESKATGLFFDLSPTVLPAEKFCDYRPNQPRVLPEWGHIFSDHCIACRPNDEEIQIIGGSAVAVLQNYIDRLGQYSDRTSEIKEKQNQYSICQRQNPHTFKSLRNIIGEDLAKEFIEKILFPVII